jgi:hypothetical protein
VPVESVSTLEAPVGSDAAIVELASGAAVTNAPVDGSVETTEVAD